MEDVILVQPCFGGSSPEVSPQAKQLQGFSSRNQSSLHSGVISDPPARWVSVVISKAEKPEFATSPPTLHGGCTQRQEVLGSSEHLGIQLMVSVALIVNHV